MAEHPSSCLPYRSRFLEPPASQLTFVISDLTSLHIRSIADLCGTCSHLLGYMITMTTTAGCIQRPT